MLVHAFVLVAGANASDATKARFRCPTFPQPTFKADMLSHSPPQIGALLKASAHWLTHIVICLERIGVPDKLERLVLVRRHWTSAD